MRANAIQVPALGSLFNIQAPDTLTPPRGRLPVYARRSFNAYGDAIGHLDKPVPAHTGFSTPFAFSQRYAGIDRLNAFCRNCQARGVQVFYLYPVYAQTGFAANKELLTRYQADFSRELAIPILDTASSFVLPDSLFFDTNYHLTKRGREIRTDKMIAILAKQGIK